MIQESNEISKKNVQQRLVMMLGFFSFFLVPMFAQTNQQWRDSLTILNKQIASQPWSTDLHLRKASVNLELQQWQYAAEEYGLVLEREPGNPAALFYQGYAYTHLRHYDMARRDYEKLLSFFPRHMQARLSLAYVLQKMGKKKDALDHLNQNVEMNPDSAVVYAARAALEYQMGHVDASLYDWQKAIKLDPQNTDYVVSQVDLLIAMQRKDEALRVLDEAVKRGVPQGILHDWYLKCRKK